MKLLGAREVCERHSSMRCACGVSREECGELDELLRVGEGGARFDVLVGLR